MGGVLTTLHRWRLTSAFCQHTSRLQSLDALYWISAMTKAGGYAFAAYTSLCRSRVLFVI